MTEFQNKPLLVLGRIYRFVDQIRSSSRLDLDGQIQPVHDVSREAELGALETGAGGYVSVSVTNTHAAADSQEGTANPFTFLPANMADSERWMWLCHLSLMSDTTAILTSAEVSVGLPNRGSVALTDYPIRRYAGTVQINETDPFPYAALNPVAGSTATQDFHPINLPFPLFPSGAGTGAASINLRTTASAAAIIKLNALCWVGPLGIGPRGLY